LELFFWLFFWVAGMVSQHKGCTMSVGIQETQIVVSIVIGIFIFFKEEIKRK
jgi:hypothetical protein